MSVNKKHPLVDNKLRSKGEIFDDTFREVNAKNGVVIWITQPDELGRVEIITNYYKCDALQARGMLAHALEDKFKQDITYSVIHALGLGHDLYKQADKKESK